MKEEFKSFVNNHKELVKYVNNGDMTWQKFYEMYSLYGDKSDVWDEYLNNDKDEGTGKVISDIVNIIKKTDVDKVQKNINSISKVLNLVSTLLVKDEEKIEYEPRPLYKKFED